MSQNGNGNSRLVAGATNPAKMHRRHFQQAAAEALDHHTASLIQTRQFMADLAARLDSAEQKRVADCDELNKRLDSLDRYCASLSERIRLIVERPSWWQRLFP